MPKRKKIIAITIIIITLTTITIIYKIKTGELNNKKNIICCKNSCFNVEIADNNKTRQLWLMYREDLDEDKWMLFVYDKPWNYSFWMKNTLIPLAWIRIDTNLKIVDIKLMEPCKTQECPSYIPKQKAQYVLEINQWLINKKWLISIWDTCKFNHEN